MDHPRFTIDGLINRRYRRFNDVVTQLTVRLLPHLLKWNTELILTGLKIISMKMQHIHFLDSVSHLPRPFRKLPEAFGLSAQKTWFPHYWNTKANLDYVGPIPDIKYFGADEMSEGDKGFLVLV